MLLNLLFRLRDLIADNQIGKSDSIVNKEMMNQFDALNEELQRRRDECIQLKTLLLAQHRLSMKQQHHQSDVTSSSGVGVESSTATDDTNVDINSIDTEGNEYEVVYNTQKILNRILENQMTDAKRAYEAEKCMMIKEIKQLRDENERNHELLMQNLSPESLADAACKNEIIKLTDQNLVRIFS